MCQVDGTQRLFPTHGHCYIYIGKKYECLKALGKKTHTKKRRVQAHINKILCITLTVEDW